MDTLKPLVALDKDIPNWLNVVAQLADGIPARQKALFEEAHHSRDPTPPRPTQRRTASLNETIRSGDSQKEADQTPKVEGATEQAAIETTDSGRGRPSARYSPPPHAPKGINPSQGSKRKRQGASVQSHASGRAVKFRHRTVGVVYYDGETQEALSKLHQQISAQRNNLRKARRDANARNFLAEGLDDSDGGNIMQKLRFARAGGSWNNKSTGEENDPYSQVDKILEEAQGLTEKAAHQVIRDGECDDEITKIRNRLTSAQSTAKDEYSKLVEKPQVKEALETEKKQKLEAEQQEREAAASDTMEVDPAIAAIEIDADASQAGDSYASVFALVGKPRTRREPMVRRRTSSLRKEARSRESDSTVKPQLALPPATSPPVEYDGIASRTRMARMKQMLLDQQQQDSAGPEAPFSQEDTIEVDRPVKDTGAMSIDEPEPAKDMRVDSAFGPTPPSASEPTPTTSTDTVASATELDMIAVDPSIPMPAPAALKDSIEVDEGSASYDLSTLMAMTSPKRGAARRVATRDTTRFFKGQIPERSRSRGKTSEGEAKKVKGASSLAPPKANKAPSMEMHLD